MQRGYNPSTYTYSSSSTNTASGQAKAVLQKLGQSFKARELHLLIKLSELCMQNFAHSMLQTRLPRPKNDENLNATIQEKLMHIKFRNQELITRVLNMQATLAKQNFSNRRSVHERQYNKCLQGIRQKSMSIKQKTMQLKKFEKPKKRIVDVGGQQTKKATVELKKLTESLAHEAIKLKNELGTVEDMFGQHFDSE